MKKFYYKALTKEKMKQVSGYIDAETPREAREKVRQLGFLPTNIYEEEPFTPIKANDAVSNIAVNRLSLDEKIFFTSELQVMLSAGIAMLEALNVISEHAHKPKIKLLAEDLRSKISKGAAFSEAIKPYEKVFGEVFTGLCITGEASGELDRTLGRMVELLKKQSDLKGKIISMSIYPACLVMIIIAVFLLCGFYIFPAIIETANVAADDVPFTVTWVIDTCNFLLHNWLLVIVMLGAGISALIKMWEQSAVKRFVDRLFLDIPLVADFVRYVNLSSFFAVMNVAYEAGIPITSAIELSACSISNSVIRRQAKNIELMTANGQFLSHSFSVTEFIPPAFNVMIATGEKSGRLGIMFRDIAVAIDKKLDMVTDALAKAFEPALTVIIGLVVAYIAIAMLQLYGSMFQSLI